MFTRRATRPSLAAVVLPFLAACSGSPTSSTPTPPSSVTQPTPATLRAAAEARGLIYGCAVGAVQLAQDASYADLVARQCGMLVPENDLKWATVHPARDAFSFERGDAVLAFAAAHGMAARGHTLVWHEGMPSWFAAVKPAEAGALLDQHIATVVGHYAGRMHSWDVVNEAIELNDGRPDGLRSSPWLSLIGPSYIERAFRAAHAADPAALLVYNEVGLEFTWSGPKRQAVLKLLRDLLARGVPVQALGLQAHLNAKHTLDEAGLRSFLDEVAGMGLQVLVTEMDVADETLPADAAMRDQAVADLYRRFLAVALAQSRTGVVMTWGLSDRYSWLQAYRPRGDGLPVRGLPFDQSYGQKAAYQALSGSLAAAPSR
jgi:endo-1,4-beta-xylanase